MSNLANRVRNDDENDVHERQQKKTNSEGFTLAYKADQERLGKQALEIFYRFAMNILLEVATAKDTPNRPGNNLPRDKYDIVTPYTGPGYGMYEKGGRRIGYCEGLTYWDGYKSGSRYFFYYGVKITVDTDMQATVEGGNLKHTREYKIDLNSENANLALEEAVYQVVKTQKKD